VSLESSPRHVEKDSVFSEVALSDSELIQRVCAGEVSLFERVMRRHNARVFRAVRAILGSEHAAEEVMQRVYLEAYKRLLEFDARASNLQQRSGQQLNKQQPSVQQNGIGQQASRVEPVSSFETWLLRIAVRESRERVRGSHGHCLRERSPSESNWGERGLSERSLTALKWEGVETEMSNLSAAGAEARGLNGVQLDEAACRDGEMSPEAACMEVADHGAVYGAAVYGSAAPGVAIHGSAGRDSGIVSKGAVVAGITAEGKQHLLATVEAAIDALPEMFRTVLVLCRVEHLSVAETAAALDLSVELVNTRLQQARAMLYENLAERAEAIAPSVYAFHLTRCDRIVAATMKQINSR
jgi:RNA polymerase sigma factor (sigma-70 family)